MEGDTAFIAIRNRKGQTVAEVAVDASDAPSLCQYRWCLGSGYVRRGERMEDGQFRNVYLHRQIMNPPDGLTVDHVDRNPLNNRRSNLRVCSQGLNNVNRLKRLGCSSIHKGVFRRRKGWAAEIRTGGVRHYLGQFASEIKAAQAYNRKAIELYGEYAVLNSVPPE